MTDSNAFPEAYGPRNRLGMEVVGDVKVGVHDDGKLAHAKRLGADLVLHGHAHAGSPEGKTTAGTPVYNVAMAINQARDGGAVYRIFEV